MASVVDSIPHTVRTANDPRQTGLYDVTISTIDQVNSRIRLLRLSLPREGPPFRHLPGQWLDVHIPSVPQAGGFTITSPPSTAIAPPSTAASPFTPPPYDSLQTPQPEPYIELAIQSSPSNPPAAYLWLPTSTLLGSPLKVRVGGRFIYPPPSLSYTECRDIDNAVFIAGGVGVNPVMSMLSAMHGLGPQKVGGVPRRVRVLYTTRRRPEGDGEVLFYERIKGIAQTYGTRGQEGKVVDFKFTMFETGGREGGVEDTRAEKDGTDQSSLNSENNTKHVSRRISHADLLESLGPEQQRKNTVVYICGPPKMTDEFVEVMGKAPGMEERRVLCEKWW